MVASAMAGSMAATPLIATSRYAQPYHSVSQHGQDESVFPSVSESPTIKIEAPIQPQPGSIVKKPQQLDSTVVPGVLESASGLTGGIINFPRVSFSPTHSVAATQQQPLGVGMVSKFQPVLGSSGASMIATQAGAGTQSTVLAQSASSTGETQRPTERLAWTRGRRSKEDEDDWF